MYHVDVDERFHVRLFGAKVPQIHTYKGKFIRMSIEAKAMPEASLAYLLSEYDVRSCKGIEDIVDDDFMIVSYDDIDIARVYGCPDVKAFLDETVPQWDYYKHFSIMD